MYKEVDTFDDFDVIIVSGVLRERPDSSIVSAGGVKYEVVGDEIVAKVGIVEILARDDEWGDLILMLDRLSHSPEFLYQVASDEVMVVVDVTEGSTRTAQQVLDLDFYSAAVYLTREGGSRKDGMRTYVPRVDVVEALVAAYQGGRIRVAESLELAGNLESALLRTSLRESKEVDTIALAAGLICYFGEDAMPVVADKRTYDTANWGL